MQNPPETTPRLKYVIRSPESLETSTPTSNITPKHTSLLSQTSPKTQYYKAISFDDANKSIQNFEIETHSRFVTKGTKYKDFSASPCK